MEAFMKVQIISEPLSRINRILPKVEPNTGFSAKATNLLTNENNVCEGSIFKFLKNIFKKTQKSEQFNVSDTPIVANLKAYYQTAGEKLNDIFLDQTSKNWSTVTVEHNLDAYNRLPDYIKACLKPNDITVDGHISQGTINKLYDAARSAKKIPCYEYPPSFWGNPEGHGKVALENVDLDSIGHFDLSSEMPSNLSQTFEGKLDAKYNIFDNVASKADAGLDHLADGISHAHDIAADKISSVVNAGGLENCDGFLEKASHIIDHIIDVATGGH